MKKLILFLTTVFIGLSCTIGKKEVSFAEMGCKPRVRIDGNNSVILYTENSRLNSALLIYDIEFIVDSIHNEIQFKGFQALDKEYKNEFHITIDGFSRDRLNKFNFFWMDSDKNKSPIEKL